MKKKKKSYIWPYISQSRRLVRLLRLSGGNCARHCLWEDQRTTFSDFFFFFGTDFCFSLQGSNEGGLNWRGLFKRKMLSLITLSWSQSLANKSVFCWNYIQILPPLKEFRATVLSKCPNLYTPSCSSWWVQVDFFCPAPFNLTANCISHPWPWTKVWTKVQNWILTQLKSWGKGSLHREWQCVQWTCKTRSHSLGDWLVQWWYSGYYGTMATRKAALERHGLAWDPGSVTYWFE